MSQESFNGYLTCSTSATPSDNLLNYNTKTVVVSFFKLQNKCRVFQTKKQPEDGILKVCLSYKNAKTWLMQIPTDRGVFTETRLITTLINVNLHYEYQVPLYQETECQDISTTWFLTAILVS